MHNNIKIPIPDMHSEAWWMRALDDELSPEEEQLWQAHREQCARCQLEWRALTQVDALLRAAPPPPNISPAFTAKTVTRAIRQQRLRQMLNFLGGLLVVALVSWVVLYLVGAAYASMERVISFLIVGRQALLNALIHTVIGLLVSWKAILPIVLCLSGITFLVLMPNSIFATVCIVWLSRRSLVDHAALG